MPKRTQDYHSWLLKRLAEPREAERYLKVAMADSPEIFLKALRNVAEANKMARVAEGAGVNRESLYKTLSAEGNPRFSTLDSVLAFLGMELTVKLKQTAPNRSEPPPETQKTGETTSVRINSNPGNALQSAGLSSLNNIFVTVGYALQEPIVDPIPTGLATVNVNGVSLSSGLSVAKPDDNISTPLEWAVIAQAQKLEQRLAA
jgi:probable addiction module antidote protein